MTNLPLMQSTADASADDGSSLEARGLVHELELRHFGSHAQTKLALDQPITFLLGGNGAGKSTIPEAIEWAITGRFARGLDAGGRGADQLVRTGSAAMSVGVRLTGIGWIRRTLSLKNASFSVEGLSATDPQAALYDRLGTKPGFVHAVFQAAAFLELDHVAAKQMLMELLDVRVPIGAELLTLEQLQQRYKTAYDDRAARKVLQKQQTVPPRPQGEEVEAEEVAQLEDKLRDLRDEERLLLEDGAEARGRRIGLDQQIGDLARERRTLTTVIAGYGDLHAELDALEQQLQAWTEPAFGELPAADEAEVARLRQQLVDDRGRLKMVTDSQAAIANQDPKRGCVLDPEIPCQTPAKEFTGRTKFIPKQIKALERSMDETETRLNFLEAEARSRTEELQRRDSARQQSAADREALERTRRQVESKLTHLQQDETRLRDVIASLAQLETDRANLGDVVDPPGLAVLRERIGRGEETIKAARREAEAWHRFRVASQTASTLAREVAELEARVELLGPKGAQIKAIGGALTEFLARINGPLGRFGYQLAISLEPWRLEVNGRHVARLSTSERLRVGICLQLALAELTGLQLAVLDNTEWLIDDEIRDVFTDLVFEWALAQPGRQVLVIKATAEAVPAIPQVAAYRVSLVDGASVVTREV